MVIMAGASLDVSSDIFRTLLHSPAKKEMQSVSKRHTSKGIPVTPKASRTYGNAR